LVEHFDELQLSICEWQ